MEPVKYTEDAQADFQNGTLTNVAGVSDSGVNVALGAAVTPSASVTSGYLGLCTDGDLNSDDWLGVGADANGRSNVTVDLGAPVEINQIKVWHYYLDGRTYHGTKTEVSEDGSTWTVVFDSAVSGEYVETSSGHTINFSARKVRYIRDWVQGNTINADNHWVEIQAFAATQNGALSLRTGSGYALHFDGVDDYIDVPDSPALSPTTITIEAVFRVSSYVDGWPFINKENQYEIGLTNSGNLSAAFYTGTWDWVTSNIVIPLNTWVHVRVSYDGNKIYFRDLGRGLYHELQNIATGNISSGTASLKFAARGTSTVTNFLAVDLSLVKLYSGANTKSTPIGVWQLDEGSGTTVHDSSGNGHDGTLYGGATWITDTAEYVSTGTRVSNVIDLSPVAGTPASSNITWTANLPANTSITVETNLSLDGGTTWQGWAAATNGGTVPGLDGADLSNARLQVRETLSTNDTNVTPQLHSLTVQIAVPGDVQSDTLLYAFVPWDVQSDAPLYAFIPQDVQADLTLEAWVLVPMFIVESDLILYAWVPRPDVLADISRIYARGFFPIPYLPVPTWVKVSLPQALWRKVTPPWR